MTAHANQALRVLVVDDNRDSADSLALLVKLQGHEAFVAYASRDGIRLAATVLPDLVIHDIELPDMDGYAAARQLREELRRRRTMFVALTAYSAKLDIQRAKDAGFHHHIVKPMSYEALQEVLDAASSTRLCDDDRLQRELKFHES